MHRLLALPLLLSSVVAAYAAADNRLLALVPANAKIVTSMNVQQALASPFGQFLLTKVTAEPNSFDQIAQQIGFDPRRDLQSFVFASTGPAPAQPSFVLLARGNFQPDLIKKEMLAQGATILTVDGIDIYMPNPANRSGEQKNRPQGAFALLDTGIGVYGDLDTVRGVIANRNTPTVLDSALQALISKISGANDAWFASTLPGVSLTQHSQDPANPKLKQQDQFLQAVRQGDGGVQFSDPVQFNFDAVARSAQDAAAMTQVVRFFASLLQAQGQKDPHAELLASALDGMVLSSSGDTFHASVAIPESTIEQLADSGIRFHHRGGSKPAPHQDFTVTKPSQK
jgi:hypothetical protein